jgi:hypothetical protein
MGAEQLAISLSLFSLGSYWQPRPVGIPRRILAHPTPPFDPLRSQVLVGPHVYLLSFLADMGSGVTADFPSPSHEAFYFMKGSTAARMAPDDTSSQVASRSGDM